MALATLLAAGCLLVAASSSYHVRRAQKDRDGRGGLLYVESYGPLSAREAIVFLPGMMGTTTYWREAGAPSLAVDRRVLLVDELGFGHSPWPEGAYTLEQHLTALEETLAKQPSGEHLILVGHSFGAMLAVEYAAVHADSVRHVILFGVPLYRGEQEARQRIGAMSALADLTARNSWLARLVCTLHAAFLPATTYLLPLLRGDLPPEVAADGALHFWPSLHGSVENIVLKHSIEPAVMLLGDKLTIVHGRRDRITPIERAREVVVASGAALIETDDDHGSYWRDATRVVRECLRIDSPPP